MATSKKPAPAPPAVNTTPPDPQDQDPVVDSPPPEPEVQEAPQYKSPLHNPEHPLHHLRNV